MQLEPIAIIGLGCRFPGAENPQAFWSMLRDGKTGIVEVPKSRWDVDAYYDADQSKPGKANTRWGGFLEDIDRFDPQFFGIAPKEAVTMDPQQRLLLEVAWSTLEDAGQIPENLKGSKTGVFIGIGTHDYSIMMWQQPVSEPYATTGTGNCIAANRISYSFDFKGPSLAVDTACSSSLVAVHLACQSIWTGESELALAGGVNMLLLPTIMVGFSKGGFMSSEGRCQSFDANADGYVRGEGAGLVLLKPLSQAEADGDDIYGVILSSAVNQDGLSNGLAAPNPQAQEAVLREAYQRVGLDPAQVDYVEAHGTGTKVGDPIEANALGAVLGQKRSPENKCLIGSVKTNIGHTETAAGIAGIIKVALALKHKQIPPSLNFHTPNPAIAFADLKLQVVTELTPWSSDKPLIAGVNSFGFGGTNAHIVMGGVEDRELGKCPKGLLKDTASHIASRRGDGGDREIGRANLLTLSAKSKSALQELAQSYLSFIPDCDRSLADICAATQQRRSHFNQRLTCIAKSSEELQQQLTAFVTNQEMTGLRFSTVSNQTKQICWLFTGQGSQYVGMGEQLYHTQFIFKQTIDRCAAILESYLDRPLLGIIFSLSDTSCCDPQPAINRTVYTQPAIFAVEYALAQLWLAWGIQPDYVAGHSIGEYVAACIAGVFSLEDGLKLVANRGRLMEQLPSSGGMLAVFSSQAKIAELIASYDREVNIAAINHQQNTVIAGNINTLAVIENKLAQLDIRSTLLEVSHAFHSPLMKPILGDFGKVAESVTYHLPQIPLVSNVTAQLADESITTSDYWIEHIIQPVNFADGFEFLLQQKIDIFLEIGAKPILSSIGATISATADYAPIFLPSLSNKQPDEQVIFNSLAQLYHQGIVINWRKFNQVNVQGIKLPPYPWQRQRYWWDRAKFWTKQDAHQQQLHPLLGNPLTLAGTSKIRWIGQINAHTPEYLADHRLESEIVFPATAYLEMALAAGKYIYADSIQLTEFIIHQPLILNDKSTQLQTVLSSVADSAYQVQIFSCELNSDVFILHSEVAVSIPAAELTKNLNLPQLQSKLQLREAEIADYYQSLSKQGLNYGVSFQGIKQIWQGEQEVLGYVELPDNLSDRASDYQIHPALLDACLQLIGIVESDSGVYLPVGIESLSLAKANVDRVWTHVTIKPRDNQQILQADLVLTDDLGQVIAEINNLSLQYLSWRSLQKLLKIPTVAENDSTNWLYEINWSHKSLIHSESAKTVDNDYWLIFALDNELSQALTQQLAGISVIFGDRFNQVEANLYTINPYQPEDWQSLWQAIDYQPSNNLRIAYFSNQKDPLSNRNFAEIFYLMQSVTEARLNLTQLTIITEQTQFKAVNNLAGGVWGLGRTIGQEYPQLHCNLLDFDSLQLENMPSLLSELLASDGETQVAYHHQQRYVARLTPQDNTLNNPFRLQLSAYGTLDNLTLVPMQRKSPQQGEIEIAVAASGVNFRDVLNALGVLKEYLQAMGFTDSTEVPFGGECVGTVVEIGKGVTNFQVGDEVIAAQAVGSLSSHVIVKAQFAIAKPKNLTYTEAATIPTTFLTAYYGLHHLAKIKPGDKILIHAAAGGVGQAAVQIAQQIGAEVYATASVGKWDFLKASGIKYVMNSRNLDFAEEVMQLTGGKGVDLILNSLNGDFIPQNLAILASNGRFVEIGKVGIWNQSQVAEQRADISYFPFDLLEVSRQDPDLINRMFAELRQQFVDGKLQPLPHQVFPIQQADDAFRYMAQAKHIGKVVISLPASNQVVKTDGSYLITGGMGALGLQVANWLAEEGAKHLILLGRSQPKRSAQQEIEQLKQQGITVDLIQIDLSDCEAVTNLFENFNSTQTKIKGIIHAAGIVDDGLLKTLSWSRFQRVLQPKVAGTWNLHQASEKLTLDWFVCFSSVVSAFGAVGQSNYATANAFMDNLMSYRRNQGLPGLSINWSIWDEVGMASRLTPEQQQRLSQQGLIAIAPPQGLKVLKQLLQQQATQTIVFPVDWATFLNQQPANPFFARVQPQAKIKIKTATSSFLQQLAQTNPSQQHHVLQSHLREQIAKVLGFADPEDVDPQEKFADLGMDSLMAVEFKNNLQASFGNAISLTAAFDYPNVELLTAYIAQELLDGNVLATTLTTIDRSPQQVTTKIPTVKKPQTVVKSSATATTRKQIEIKPEYSQFKLTPEYLNLKQDLQRVEKLGNPFFSLHQGIAQDTIQINERQLINYSSYNYLGMSGDPTVIAATQQAIAEYGTSVSASRVLSGERPIHLELEQEIADLIGTEAAIVYVGGHATNVSTIGHLFGKQDLIICDTLCHNSIKEGCNLAGATIVDFPHNDTQALAEILNRERTKYQKVLIAIEGIYSTDGDLAPLSEIVALKQHYQTFLLVDEAHSIGVLGLSGGGIREHYHLLATDVDLWMGTLSKSFASCGGYIAGSSELIEYLKYTSPGFVFSVGMSPANTAAALAAIKLLKSEPERAIKLQSRAKFCLNLAKSKGFNTGYSKDSPVIPIIVGEPHKAVRLSQLLNQAGINVNPMVYPSVPYDAARLRFFITCLHTEAQIQQTIEALEEIGNRK
ncbi:MAG: aminotransferase class I/II-fold pyridoxal phosphate-dependent enzyme [Pleurocapsa minor HA4230-MV1]|jgi:myxalamid-type polyketide synthase MxaB|nr:aminotransferase class I/II-fold pyridoxal phosphate-dependent enzyme [Pleurocapsa minor HA4230-MV1]